MSDQPPTPLTDFAHGLVETVASIFKQLCNIITNHRQCFLISILCLKIGSHLATISDQLAQLQLDQRSDRHLSYMCYSMLQKYLINSHGVISDPSVMEQIQSVLLPIVSSPPMQYVFALCTLLAFTATIFYLFDRCISHDKPVIKKRHK